MAKSAWLQVRLDEDELEIIRKASEAVGKSISDYVRELVLPNSSALLSGDDEKVKRMFTSTGVLFLTQLNIQRDT